MSANFEGPKLKLNRAKKHIEQLDKLIGHYVAGEPYVLTQKIDPETGLRVFGFEEKIPVPTGITLLFGDAMHNLRTVLDMLVFEVTVANGGNRSYTGFPFHEERRGVETALRKGEMRFAPAPIKTFIIEGVKPYKAGDYGLWAMNKLDNIDKHRLLLAITGIVGVRGDFVIGTQRMYNCTMGLTFGKNGMFVLSDDKVEFKINQSLLCRYKSARSTFFIENRSSLSF